MIKLSTIRSKKNNPFLVVTGGRTYGLPPWLTAEEAQGILDNVDTVRAFITEHLGTKQNTKSVPSRRIVPFPAQAQAEEAPEQVSAPAAAPTPEEQVPVQDPSRGEKVRTNTAPESVHPAPPTPLPKEEGVARAQTNTTQNINPRVAALVAKAMGKSAPASSSPRRFSSVA